MPIERCQQARAYFMSENGSNGNGNGAADRLREHIKTMSPEIVDVKVPSGFVYKFEKPSKFSLLFEMTEIPQETSSAVVDKWIADGVVEINKDGQIDKPVKIIDSIMSLLERTALYSCKPKLILSGIPANNNEFLASQIPPGDLEYLMRWVKSGGETAAMLSMFPDGRRQGSLASASRSSRRRKV